MERDGGHDPADARPAALLRGNARGLEIVVDGHAPADAIIDAVTQRLEEAPAFFRGADVRVGVDDGPLAPGCLARLDDLAARFELRIVEVAARRAAPVPAPDHDAVPRPAALAAGSAPSTASPHGFEDEPTRDTSAGLAAALPADAGTGTDADAERTVLAPVDLSEVLDALAGDAPEPELFDEPTQTAAPLSLAATAEAEPATGSPGTRIVVGPVRSGVILEHAGHLIVFGDVNPGAEVRAEGNIVVLGRLRGTAHAGIGQDIGFILALRLEPQQLRIGRLVARAGDSDAPDAGAELAYVTSKSIVVERYLGRLPRDLATSI